MLGSARQPSDDPEDGVPQEPKNGARRCLQVRLSRLAVHDGPNERCQVEKEKRQERGAKQSREAILTGPEERVRDVAAVELTPRQEIQHREQEPCPSGERGR